jgi:hypothetical protein
MDEKDRGAERVIRAMLRAFGTDTVGLDAVVEPTTAHLRTGCALIARKEVDWPFV